MQYYVMIIGVDGTLVQEELETFIDASNRFFALCLAGANVSLRIDQRTNN